MSGEPIDDGGPVFPMEAATRFICPGISLRDYFAAKALQATVPMGHEELQEFTDDYDERTTCELAAVVAYEIADAMIKVRKL